MPWSDELEPADARVRVYDPVGYCIYCTSTDDLSDEHIVPFGLGGSWVLPKASCEECRTITGRQEQRVLRGPLWAVRAARGLRSRRPRDAPTDGELIVVRGGEEERVVLPLDEFPVIFAFPVFPPPAVVTGVQEDAKEGIRPKSAVWIAFGRPKPDEVAKKLRADTVRLTLKKYYFVEFARIIAKIAYSFAAAEGLLNLIAEERSPILPALLEKERGIGRWVGTYMDPLEKAPSGFLHAVKIARDSKRGLLIGQVKLFADTESPVYGVVLGHLRE